MPATLRLELFSNSPTRALHLYANTLNFQILVRNNADAYIFLQRDHIFLALLAGPDPLSLSFSTDRAAPRLAQGEGADVESKDVESKVVESKDAEHKKKRAELLDKTRFRRPPYGVEIVIEVDDLDAERDRVVAGGYVLAEDVRDREWGLRDFRVVDVDGYYLRFTEHSPGRNGLGAERQGEALGRG